MPFIDESPASWIQRVCARNAFSMTRLKQALKIPASFDLDVDLRERDWINIHRHMGFERDWEIHRQRLRLVVRPMTQETFQDAARKLRYCWCPYCFFEDKEPYFRWSWRCNHGLCSVHGTALYTSCPHCGDQPNLAHTFHVRTLNMAHCQGCTRWLGVDPELRRASQREPGWMSDWGSPSARLAIFRDELRRRVEAVVRGAAAPDADWRLWRGGMARPPALRLDWKQFVWPDKALDHRRKWSWSAPRNWRGRARLAAALRLVRFELRTARHDAATEKVIAAQPDKQATRGGASWCA